MKSPNNAQVQKHLQEREERMQIARSSSFEMMLCFYVHRRKDSGFCQAHDSDFYFYLLIFQAETLTFNPLFMVFLKNYYYTSRIFSLASCILQREGHQLRIHQN